MNATFAGYHKFKMAKNANDIMELENTTVGGRGGIRTHGTVSRTPVFKTGSLNHSDTLPLSEGQSLPALERCATGLRRPHPSGDAGFVAALAASSTCEGRLAADFVANILF